MPVPPPSPGSATSRRPHRAARVEDRVNRAVVRVLRGRGWTERVEAYAGYGGPGWVRVMARVVLAAPVVQDDELPGAGSAEQTGAEEAPRVRGWRSFLTAQVPDGHLVAHVGGLTHRLAGDRGGYVDAVVPADLPPGWHDVPLESSDGRSSTARVLVVAAEQRTGLVSDIDDTVMVTRLPRPLVAAWNSLVRSEAARETIPGMADLYAGITGGDPGVPVVYLSTGAWNAAPALARFLRRHRYPAGPMLLTDWGPTNTGWFRSGKEHKVAQLERLVAELPDVRWVLVGDDGQRDPEVYSGVVQRHRSHVRAVLIRQLTFAEHVLAHGAPVPTPTPRRRGPGGTVALAPRADDVAVLQGPDGDALLREARERGLVG
ncbi:App1 family protein [Cellulomonas endophytica]|uniref:App1 family protein n=1 Tax=Cellulomonas endophytica TaxID=2494735 RepID=UPI0010114476|nr:phosphatase domain-containing protein [Cellulomonas endophytica]